MMSKFVIISTFFLLPFVTISAFAQFELPKYELPPDYIITYELDEEDENEQQEKKARRSLTVQIIVTALLMGFILYVILSIIAFNRCLDDLGDS